MKKKMNARMTAVTGITVLALTATLMGGITISAAGDNMISTSPAPEWIDEEQWRSAVYVSFRDFSVSLTEPPRLVDGVIMVQAKALLKGIGYSISWDSNERTLSATQANKPAWMIRNGNKQASVGTGQFVQLAQAPFIENGTMWIPLRSVAEAAGLNVMWDERNRLAIVSDPMALPRISIMTQVPDHNVDTPAALLDYMKEAVKANVEISWVGPEFYREKTMVMLAAGDMKSLMLFHDPFQLNDEIMSSVTIELEPYLKDFPRLKELSKSTGARRINGKTIAIPRLSDPHQAEFPSIRKDWLDVLGLTLPETMDEVYEVLKAFASQDPDGNGKHDTWALTGRTNGAGLGSFGWVEHAFTGSPERFSIKDGIVIDHVTSQQEVQALQWLAKAYKDGLLDPEFAIVTPEKVKEQIASNQTGLQAMSIEQAASYTSDRVHWLPLGNLKAKAASAPIAPWNSTGSGSYIVSTMARQNPALLLEWLEHGIAKTLDDQWNTVKGWQAADQAAVNSLFGQPDMLKNNAQLEQLPTDIREGYESAVEQWRAVSYEKQLLPEAGTLWSSGKYANINQQVTEQKIKFIMGAISVDEWNSFVQELVASKTYKDMLNQLNELAAKRS